MIVFCSVIAGCAVDTSALVRDRLQFNELVKTTNEQQMLLNIVRLRYSDTPSSLAVTSIAAQSEVVRSFGITPFFGLVGGRHAGPCSFTGATAGSDGDRRSADDHNDAS